MKRLFSQILGASDGMALGSSDSTSQLFDPSLSPPNEIPSVVDVLASAKSLMDCKMALVNPSPQGTPQTFLPPPASQGFHLLEPGISVNEVAKD